MSGSLCYAAPYSVGPASREKSGLGLPTARPQSAHSRDYSTALVQKSYIEYHFVIVRIYNRLVFLHLAQKNICVCTLKGERRREQLVMEALNPMKDSLL